VTTVDSKVRIALAHAAYVLVDAKACLEQAVGLMHQPPRRVRTGYAEDQSGPGAAAKKG